MGMFTDLYNVGAVVSKPVSQIIRYGAFQADKIASNLLDGDNAVDSEATQSKYNMGEQKLVQAFQLIKESNMNDKSIANFLSDENETITEEQVETLRKDIES